LIRKYCYWSVACTHCGDCLAMSM